MKGVLMRFKSLSLTVVLAVILTACPNANRLPTTPPPSPPASGGSTETPQPPPSPEPEPPAPPPAPTWVGTKTVNSDPELFERGRDVALDGQGNVFQAVSTNKLVTNNPTPSFTTIHPSAGAILIVKLAPDGEILWKKTLDEGPLDSQGLGRGIALSGMATDTNGNLVVTGKVFDWVRIQSGTSSQDGVTTPVYGYEARNQDAFITKLDSSGSVAWKVILESTGDNGATGVAIDGQNRIRVTGFTCGNGQVFYGNTIKGDCDQFISAFEPNGTRAWLKLYGGNFNDLAGGIATDADGNAIIVGASFTTQKAPLAATPYAVRFSSAGTQLWVNTANAPNQYAISKFVGLTPSGQVVIAGETNGIINGSAPGNRVGTDVFLMQLSSDGQTQWTKRIERTEFKESEFEEAFVGYQKDAPISGGYPTVTALAVTAEGIYINGTSFTPALEGPDMPWPVKFSLDGNLIARANARPPQLGGNSLRLVNIGNGLAANDAGVFFTTEVYLVNTPASANLIAKEGGAYIVRLNLNLEP